MNNQIFRVSSGWAGLKLQFGNIYGQLQIAEVVMEGGNKLNVFKLKKHCLQKLDSYEIPKEFIEVEFIKKTYGNKIKRE